MLKGSLIDRRSAPRIRTNGRMPGRLVLDSTGEEIVCQSIDVSAFGMGLDTDEELPLEAGCRLETPNGVSMLNIVSCQRLSERPRRRRYGLFLMSGADLLEMFQKGQCLKDTAEESSKKTGDRSPRFTSETQMFLLAQTFGTREIYRMSVENISRSGILLALAGEEKVPFQVNTLLDLTLDPEMRVFTTPILSTGKIVRRVNESQAPATAPPGVRFGITISDIAPQCEDAWNAVIDAIET